MSVSVFCFLASYTVAFGLECVRLARRSAINRLFIIASVTAGLVAHTSYLWLRADQSGLPPLLASSHDWLLVLTWLAVLLYLVVTLADRDLAIGFFVLPLVLALIGAAYLVSQERNPALGSAAAEVERSVRGWGMLHATLLVFGITGVVGGFVLSMMYLYQHRRLKHRRAMHRGLSLPSLERLSRLNWWSVVLSIPLLTLGMLIGVGLALYTWRVEHALSFGDPVVVVFGAAWCVMVAFFVWLLGAGHPAGIQVAWRTAWAFGFLLAILVGLQVLRNGKLLDSWHAGQPPCPCRQHAVTVAAGSPSAQLTRGRR